MSYAYHFGPDGIKPVEGLGKHGPVIAGDLLAIWYTEGQEYPKYLIDGMEGGMTPIGTFEKEVGAATFQNGILLIATKEYVEAHMADVDDAQGLFGEAVLSVDKETEFAKRIESEARGANTITNDDLVCGRCLYATDRVDSCELYLNRKPSGVYYGKACEDFEDR